MKKLQILGAIIIVLLIFFGIWEQRRVMAQGEEFFIKFNEANIIGEIEYVRIGYHGAVFKILEDPREFVFYPYTDQELNQGRIFNWTAERGDSIVKPAFADTLKLIKNSEILLYTFRKWQ